MTSNNSNFERSRLSAARRLWVAALIVVTTSGCNLTLDLDDYPYAGEADARDATADATEDASDVPMEDTRDAQVEDVPEDTADATDTQQEDRPIVIFTEIMPDSSVEGNGSVEYGEFIEVKNVGKVPVDPRRVVIELEDADRRIAIDPFASGEDEEQILDELQPIQPGEYFVFVRQDSDYYGITQNLEPGTFYEYGRWNEQVPLANNERSLTLFYRVSEFEAVVTDKIEWVSRSLIDPSLQTAATRELREDISLGVQEVSESQSENDSPSNWCYHAENLPNSPVKASPGGPTPATCTVD